VNGYRVGGGWASSSGGIGVGGAGGLNAMDSRWIPEGACRVLAFVRGRVCDGDGWVAAEAAVAWTALHDGGAESGGRAYL
jgi:hypothetical protein